MSATTTTPAVEPQLPELPVAMQTVFDRVHKRAFLEKVAQIAPAFLPRSEAAFADMLAIGDDLQAADMIQAQKTASAGSPFAAARAALEQTMAEEGLDHGIKQASHAQNTDRLRTIAANLLQDPELYDAALAIKIAQFQSQEQTNG